MSEMIEKKASKTLKCPICGEMGYLVHENRKKYRRKQIFRRGKEFGTGKWVTTKYSTDRVRRTIFRIIHKDNSHCYLGVIGSKHDHILSRASILHKATAEYDKVLREGAKFAGDQASN